MREDRDLGTCTSLLGMIGYGSHYHFRIEIGGWDRQKALLDGTGAEYVEIQVAGQVFFG